jgi:hypothetical protein
MNAVIRVYRMVEQFLGNLPRTLMLFLAVYCMRNPLMGHFQELYWPLKCPVEFLLLLLLALALSSALRLVMSHGNESPADQIQVNKTDA